MENVKVIKQISRFTKQNKFQQNKDKGGAVGVVNQFPSDWQLLKKRHGGLSFAHFPEFSLTQRSNLLIISLHCPATNISFSPHSCFSKPNDASPNQFVCILFHIPSCDSLPFYNPALLAINHCSPCSNK